jgi:hypothetical protein
VSSGSAWAAARRCSKSSSTARTLRSVLSADIGHFDDADPEVHPSAWKLAEHLRGVIRAATSIPSGYALNSALPCRLRPGRRPCRGWIKVVRQDVPPHIYWDCSACDDSGVIHGWEASPYDLRPPRPLHEQALIVIDVTAEEHAELRRLQLLDADSERLVWGTYRENDRLVLFGTADDVDNLVGYVAFESNHLTDRRRQRRLDAVLRKLEAALRTFA